MPKPKTTKLTSFEFTEEEMYAATRFTQLNMMLLQTLAVDAATDRLEMKIDLAGGKSYQEATMEFLQREAALKGQQEAYENLLMLAADTELPTPKGQS